MALRPDMAAAARSRGRPKGSGIDDRDRLTAVVAALAADQRLKPTTAIKQLGITDPSAIRRLRDKLAIAAPATDVARTSKPRSAVHSLKAKSIAAPAAAAAVSPAPINTKSDAQAPPIESAERRTREAALLTAYLDALARTPQAFDGGGASPSAARPDQRSAQTTPPAEPRDTPATHAKPETSPEPAAGAVPPFSFPGMPPMPSMPGMPGFPAFPGFPPMSGVAGMTPPAMGGFSMPGFPSFMQPFQAKPAGPPQSGTAPHRQLEALKLAIEATTSIARFQLHLVENAAAYSPMAMMLQGQSFMGQMIIASLTGQLDAMRRQMTGAVPDKKDKP